MNTRDRFLAGSVAVLWGCNFLAMEFALRHFPPLFFAGLRFFVIAIPTLLFVPLPRVRWYWLLGYGLGFATGQFAFLFLAIAAGMPIGLASLVLQASAPFTVLLGAILLRERISAIQAIGIGIAILGMTLIGWQRAQAATLLPVVLTVLGALSWAFGNLCNRKANPPNPVHLTLWISVVPPIPMFTLSALFEGPVTGWHTIVTSVASTTGIVALVAMAYIVLPSTILGASLWTTLMQRNPASVVAPFSLLVPVIGITSAWLVLDERPTLLTLGAGVLVILGVLLGSVTLKRNRGTKLPSEALTGG